MRQDTYKTIANGWWQSQRWSETCVFFLLCWFDTFISFTSVNSTNAQSRRPINLFGREFIFFSVLFFLLPGGGRKKRWKEMKERNQGKERKNTVMSYDQRLVETAKCLLLYETLVTIFHTRGKKKKKKRHLVFDRCISMPMFRSIV